MPHSAEGLAFLTRLNALPEGPGVVLDDVLEPSLIDEQELRKLFAQDKANPRLDNPYVGLVDVFGPNTEATRKTRSRVVDSSSEESMYGHYVMPLKDNQRRKDGDASMTTTFDEFKRNWSIFTEGSLSQLSNWNNVIAAGGSVLSALLPLSDKNKENKRAIRKYYHSAAYPASDVDLFLWGLTPAQAEKKIVEIYEAVRDSVPWDVTCIRTKHTVSIHSQYPYRSVQIVLRLYRSPAEILAGFDIDAPCCAYDGEHVWANPRAITAMIRQCNTVDISRRSPSYELRLAKYAKRGFEIFVPNLRREDIDPTIYERSIAKIQGLARLLALEKLDNEDARQNFLQSRADLRGRPYQLRFFGGRGRRKYKNDLKTDTGGLEMNDYDVASLHIPYGPGWDARRIEKLIYQTDLGMNSTFNPKNKGRRLHRHPAFFGTVEECMEDCCQHCPEPIDEDERNLQKQEDELYIHGRISFIEENPGRQSLSGSFNPIDDGEWSEQVYIRPIQKLFSAIASHDIALVRSLLAAGKVDPKAPDANTNGINLQHRDHVGRTALHLAILVKDEEIAKLLVDEGCRMIARLVDGRTALHLAAQYGLDGLIEKMFEKSKQNKEAAEKKGKLDKDEDEEMKDDSDAGPPDSTTDTDVRPSSEDDWSSEDNGEKEDDSMDVDGEGGYDKCDDVDNDDDGGKNGETGKEEKVEEPTGEAPEDNEEEPDVLDVNASDWDQRFTPLCYAALYSTSSTVSLLLKHEADPNLAADSSAITYTLDYILPLFLALVRPDEDTAVDVAQVLIEGGASSSATDPRLVTVLHQAVLAGKAKILDLFLRKDPGAKQALDFPIVSNGSSTFPVSSAVAQGKYAELLTLLAYGAKINPTSSDILKAKAISKISDTSIWGYNNVPGDSAYIKRTVETAIQRGDYILDLLVEVGADVSVGTAETLHPPYYIQRRESILDWVVRALEVDLPEAREELRKQGITLEDLNETKENEGKTNEVPQKFESWKEFLKDYQCRYSDSAKEIAALGSQREPKVEQLKGLMKKQVYLEHVRRVLELAGAKTWKEINSNSEEQVPTPGLPSWAQDSNQAKPGYRYLTSQYWRRLSVPEDQNGLYDELFEAAFQGDDAKIEKLCATGADSNAVSLQITVEARVHEYRTGLTPFYAAVVGKKWSTAKLIVGIAAAQYQSDDDKEKDKLKAALFDLVDDQEPDDDDDDSRSYSSESTVDQPQRQTKFVDIAKKISLRTDAHPSLLLDANVDYMVGGKMHDSTLLVKAVRENDFNSFDHLFNIEESVQKKTYDEEDRLFHAILDVDNPKILDELIRSTGIGLDVETARKTTGDAHPIASNDQNRLYLGLNIHGKKRADLARKGDPNNSQRLIKHVPLVWRAISYGAKSILEYLSSEKPLLAYKHFATNGEGDKAEWLRYSKNLESSLSELLGWRITPLGESPLTAAIVHCQMGLLPVLFTKAAKLMGSALHLKIKFYGFNALLVAASSCNSSKLTTKEGVELWRDTFDFLLKKGISALEIDTENNWNIYHWLCYNKSSTIMEYLLERLPQDISEQLLARKSKGKLSLPLHLAVKSGSIRLVKAILAFTKDGLLDRDALGFTPLHHAIRCGYSSIVEQILEVSPPEGLYLENGVGKTPYEDAQKRAMKPITDQVSAPSIADLGKGGDIKYQDDSQKLERELSKVVETLDRLVSNGTLDKGSSLANAFEKFVSANEGRLAKTKAPNQESTNPYEDQMDCAKPIETLTVIEKAISGDGSKRILAHVKDVQRSVATALESNQVGELPVEEKDVYEEEEEYKEKAGLMAIDSFFVPHDP